MVASENKVTFGLKNTHYAVITDDGKKITYGTPAALPGATKLTLDASGNSIEFFQMMLSIIRLITTRVIQVNWKLPS